MIIPHKQQLVVSMSILGRGLCTVGLFNLLLFLLSSIITCKPCSVRDVPTQFEVDACGSYQGSFVDPHNGFSGGLSYKHSHENVCQYSSSFCFPSTVPSFSDSETEAELASSYGDRSEPFSSVLEQTEARPSSLPDDQGIFRFIFDRNISCTLLQKDGYLEFLSSYGESAMNSKLSDISYCFSNLVGNKSTVLKSEHKPGKFMLDDSFTPLVEIKPSPLDWGRRTLYEVSKVFLTIQNTDPNSVLTVYDIYSSNSQFYSCNFSSTVLAPGEVMSICLAFFPTEVGPSTGQLVLQTSFGGFLILANGYSVESPYLVKTLGGFDVSSNGRWRKDISLFNPFDEAIYMEEVTVWMFTSLGNDSHATLSVCNIRSSEVSLTNIAMNPNDWFGVAIGEQWHIALKPHENWEIAPRHRETIMEIDVSDRFEGNLIALFGLNVRKSSDDEAYSMIIPIEEQFNHQPNAIDTAQGVTVSLEALVPCNVSGLVFIALSVLNNAPYILSLVKVVEESDGTKTFTIKSMEGLVLFPGTTTQVAVLSYSSVGTHRESDGKCKLLVLTNDTRNSRVEIPCKDVFRVCSASQSDSLKKEMRSVVNYIDEGQRYVIISGPLKQDYAIKGVDTIEADEVVLRNWKSQATESGTLNTLLDQKELVFPMVLLGNYSSKMITVKNRSPRPVVMQLILNLAEIIDNCRTSEIPSHHLSSKAMLVNTSVSPTRYGFSVAKDALTEAHVHPNGTANLGPILFQPYKRCEWRSSALIKNNASGVEWISLRGFGGSHSLVLLDGYDPVEVLDFNLNSPSSISSSSKVGKNHSCPHPFVKEVNVKNIGDIPLEVARVKVSGANCGLAGFRVRNCEGFYLRPGETKELAITYHADYSVSTVQRDLELVLASGVVVIPMKVSIPICLIDFCKSLLFWARIKKSILGILISAFVLYLLFFSLFPRAAPGSTFLPFKGFRKPSSPLSVIRGLSSLQLSLNLKNGQIKSMVEDKAVLLDHYPAIGCTENLVSETTVKEKQMDSISSEPSASKSSSCDNVVDAQEDSIQDSKILKVRVGKEQGKRRRKKKTSASRLSSSSLSSSLFVEVSSSQSGNSTPSSPISPVTSSSSTPRRSTLVSTNRIMEEEASSVAVKPKTSSNISKDRVSPSRYGDGKKQQGVFTTANNSPAIAVSSAITTQDSKKMAGRAILLPSSTFPRTLTAWSCHSPFLGLGLSPIGPCARASKFGEVRVEKEESEKNKYTYDIWGDHLFENALAHIFQSTKNMGRSEDNSSSVMSAALFENNSDSFFMWDPPGLMNKALMESSSVSSNMQVDD